MSFLIGVHVPQPRDNAVHLSREQLEPLRGCVSSERRPLDSVGFDDQFQLSQKINEILVAAEGLGRPLPFAHHGSGPEQAV
jgi:hypothetical protein